MGNTLKENASMCFNNEKGSFELDQNYFSNQLTFEKAFDGVFVGCNSKMNFQDGHPNSSSEVYIPNTVAFEFTNMNVDGLTEGAKEYYRQLPIIEYLKRVYLLFPDKWDRSREVIELIIDASKDCDKYLLCLSLNCEAPVILIHQSSNKGLVVKTQSNGNLFEIVQYQGSEVLN